MQKKTPTPSVFRKSRSRIVLLTMIFLILCQVMETASIYITTYLSVSKNNQTRLMEFTEKYGFGSEILTPPPDTEESLSNTFHPIVKYDRSDAVTMYMVTFDPQGNAVKLYNNINPIMDDESFIDAARKLVEQGKTAGNFKNLIYRITRSSDGTVVVAMMDSTILNESYRTLIRNMILVGILTILLFFGIVLYLSGRIIAPLEENDRKEKQFISDAGHELKTPLAVMQTNLEMLTKEQGSSHWAENISYELKRMQELVRELLDLARFEGKDAELLPLNLSRLILGEILPMESFAYERSCILEEEIEEDLMIPGDAGRLRQLVSILLENAISHTPAFPDGRLYTVKVSLKQEKKYARFTVSNEGTTIPPDELSHLFDRFYKSDSSRKEDGHYGLGLAIAKAVTESHHGDISVESRDGITCFTVKLPIVKDS